MGAVHGGLLRQGSKPLQGQVHVGSAAFKQPSAATTEQGVAAEQGRVSVLMLVAWKHESDMGSGVRGHVDDLDLLTQ